MRCGCGKEIMTGDIEGICTRCRNAMNQAKQCPQNLPKVGSYTMLDDVRTLKETIEAYKECFEKFIPSEKWDEATIFLSTYGSELAKNIFRKES